MSETAEQTFGFHGRVLMVDLTDGSHEVVEVEPWVYGHRKRRERPIPETRAVRA